MNKPDFSQDALTERLSRVKGFVIDMDGTLVLGDKRNHGLKPLPGALDFIAHLKAKDIPFVALTNGTVRPPAAYVPALGEAGFKFSERQILTPASSAADYLKAKRFKRVMILGGDGVGEPIREAGIEIVRPPEYKDVDAIFVGWFRDFTMSDIEAACEAVWNGAKLFTASNAPFFASANGRTLGTSCAIIGAISKITGTRAKVLGKPSPEALRCASRRLSIAPSDLAVIGDDPALEVAMARKAGATAIGVTTGIANEEDFLAVPEAVLPHMVAANIGEVLKVLRRA